jgi:hypothetical protein
VSPVDARLYLKSNLAYNLVTLRKPAGFVLSLLFLAISALVAPLLAQQQAGPARVSRLLLIIPFENAANSGSANLFLKS